MKVDALLALSLSVLPAQAGDTFTATFYAYEDSRNHALHSHTFATFDRLRGNVLVERVTVSWGPRDGRPALLVAVPGRNASLEATLAYARGRGLAVYAAGPFPCHAELFFRAKARVVQLQGGMLYVVVDGGHDRRGVNCIGAILSIFPNPPRTGTLHGRQATEVVVKHFKHYLR